LKAQINPHFLFNTLNGIYAQAITKSEHTADSIQKLSALMRYVITEANENKVFLEKEITYLKNYIQLQKLRLTDKTKVNFTVSGDSDKKKIAPLLLICFIENAFKYGVSNEVNSTIEIAIEIENDEMTLRVKNEKVTSKTENIESDKIGLKNAKKRMDLIYEKAYSLNIEDKENEYNLVLKIIVG
ncbi:MAG: sensor histidine kinase, partial [Bacteroidia bacterium]